MVRQQRLWMKTCACCNQHRDTSTMRLTKSGNDAEVTHSTNLRIHKSQVQFESDTYICNNILLNSAKYIIGLLLLYLSIHYSTPFMGECWSYKRTVAVYGTLTSALRAYIALGYFPIPSVACQHTEGEYHWYTSTHTY